MDALFVMRDFAAPKPAHAEACRYCHEDDNGSWTTLDRHQRDHLPMTCSVCGKTEPNALIFRMSHGGPGWISPVKCTSLMLRLNHLTYDLLHQRRPDDRDLTALDLGWRIAPNGEQLPPADWNELHPPTSDFPGQIYDTHPPIAPCKETPDAL